MTLPTVPRTRHGAPRARTRAVLAASLALTACAVGVGAATAGQTPRRPPLQAAPLDRVARTSVDVPVVEEAVLIQRASQRVDATAGMGPTAPAWLRRSAGELPAEAAAAYLLAARTIHTVAPQCGVSAPLLAGLGRVVSDHGRHTSSRVAGPPSPDTDGGRLDHDARTDRPVGPMRMLPSTWTAAGVDADGDGVRDPRDPDDAALAAAVYLCAAFDTGTPAERVDRALAAWDGTPGFAQAVRRLARAYAGDRYDAVWHAGQAAPVAPQAEALTMVARHLGGAHLAARSTGDEPRGDGSARPTKASASVAAAVEAPAAPSAAAPPVTPPVTPPAPSPTPEPTPATEPEPAPAPAPAPTEPAPSPEAPPDGEPPPAADAPA